MDALSGSREPHEPLCEAGLHFQSRQVLPSVQPKPALSTHEASSNGGARGMTRDETVALFLEREAPENGIMPSTRPALTGGSGACW